MDITSKFSLYDVLAMIIPGGIIMASIAIFLSISSYKETIELCCGCSIEVNKDLTIIEYFFLLAFAYIIGLINNWINDGLFRYFRNNTTDIYNELKKVINKNRNIHLNKYIDPIYFNDTSIRRFYYIAFFDFVYIMCALIPCEVFGNIRNPKDYYEVYYRLSRKNLLGSVPLIESQVALLRNCILPLIALLIATYVTSLTLTRICTIGTLRCTIAILIISFFIVMVQRQNKIYYIIWESANYYDL